MRTRRLVIALALLTPAMFGQQAQPQKLFASNADVAAMIAKAKTDHKPDQANFIQTIVGQGQYQVHLEYRIPGVASPSSVHEKEAELFFVVEGTGTMTTGGKLRDEKRTNATNLSGTGIEGGTSKQVAKGDFMMVPENTPHGFAPSGGPLVLMSVHLPR